MGKRRAAKLEARQHREAALAFTWHVVNEYRDGSFSKRQALLTRFPPSIGPGEKIFCVGGYKRYFFGAAGSGSSSSFVAGGTGPLGVAMLAATGAAAAASKTKARSAAQDAWRELDTGAIFISNRGFYLENTRGVFPFSWNAMAESDLIAPGILQFGANITGGGYSRYRMHSEYSELSMLSWAMARHPNHPYLTNYLAQIEQHGSDSTPQMPSVTDPASYRSEPPV